MPLITFDPVEIFDGGTKDTQITVVASPYRLAGWEIPLDSTIFAVKSPVAKTFTGTGTLDLIAVDVGVWCYKFTVTAPGVQRVWVKIADVTVDQNFVDLALRDPETLAPITDVAPTVGELIDGLQAQIDAIEASDVESVNGQTGVVTVALVESPTDSGFYELEVS